MPTRRKPPAKAPRAHAPVPSAPTIDVPPIGGPLLHVDFDDTGAASDLAGLDVSDDEDTVPAELFDALAEAWSTTR